MKPFLVKSISSAIRNAAAVIRSTRFKVLVLFYAVSVSMFTTVQAADQNSGIEVTPEVLFKYFQQDIFIAPGVGFLNVRIGQSFEVVAQSWGVPNRTYDSDIGSKIAWVYDIDHGSEVAVSGSTRVESIEITGSFNSPFTSREGANFGMTPHQIISIYGQPKKGGNLAKLSYPEKGITFRFTNGSLQKMRVYSPTS